MISSFALIAALCFVPGAAARPIVPEHEATPGGLVLKGVSPDCPVVYDNDFWTDVPDAAYAWAQASAGKLNLRGNVVTRCTYGWQTRYAHHLDEQVKEAEKLFDLARRSGLRNVPRPVVGSTVAMRKPASGRVEDTQFGRSAGSELVVAEARKASPDKPLLVFCGGSCTTVAAAYLSDPAIAERMVVFQIDGGGYNGSDAWAWEIAMKRCRFANWARGYFWEHVSTWDPAPFESLPRNPLCDWLRAYATKGHGKANQWGDGPWLYWLFDRRCLTKAQDYDGAAITIPKEGTDAKRMAAEFLRAMKDQAAYHPPAQ